MFIHLKNIIKQVTVELSFLFFCVTNELIKFLHYNLYLQKACRFNQTSEPNLDTKCDDESRGILFVSEISSKYYPVNFFLCHVVIIFATCWSDEAGRRRRPLIFIPLISVMLASLSACFHSYFWYWNPLYAVFTEVLFESFSGGMGLITFASQMYLCDICSVDSRTMRLGVLATIKTITILIGKGGSGFILRSCGFLFSYLVCFLLSTFGLVIGLWLIEDKSVAVPIENRKKIHQIFNIGTVLDCFRIVFKKNLGRKRIVVLLLLITSIAAYFTTCGEFSVIYLYLRYRFQWDERKYSIFMMYKFAVSILGGLFASIVLSKRFKVHDGLIGMFAGFWDTLAVLGLLFASQDWHVYLIPLLDIFHGAALSVCTSFMSKYYSSDEFGRLGAVYNVLGLISPFCYPVYNIIFQKTMHTFPSMFCILSIVLDIGIVVLYGISYHLSRKFDNPKSIEKIENH